MCSTERGHGYGYDARRTPVVCYGMCGTWVGYVPSVQVRYHWALVLGRAMLLPDVQYWVGYGCTDTESVLDRY